MTFYFTDVSGTTPVQTLAPVQTFISAIAAQTIITTRFFPEGQIDTLDEATGDLLSSDSVTTVATLGAISDAESLPLATQGVLRLDTNDVLAGKRLRGRLYLPQPRRNVTGTNQQPSGNYRDAINAAAANLITATTSIGPWVVWSKKNGQTRAVELATVWPKWGVLRSRRD